MATKIQARRDTRANWETANPVLSQGEPGLEIDTGRFKFGDGVTKYNELPHVGSARKKLGDGTYWGVEEIKGVKEFTFTTRGHRWLPVVAAQTGEAQTSFTVSSETYPDVADLYAAYTTDGIGSVRVMPNNDINNQLDINSITFDDAHTYTFTLGSGSMDLISGTTPLLIIAWWRGTKLVYNDLYESYGWRAASATSNSNVVVIDAGEGTSDFDNYLMTNPTKCSLVFDDKPTAWINDGQHLIDDERNVLSVTKNGSLYTITFDGEPISVRTDYTPSVNAVASQAVDNAAIIYINRTLYPQLADWVYYAGGTVTVNNQTVNISYVDQYEDNNITYYGDNWVIWLNGNITCAVGDAVVFSYSKPGTDITLELYRPNHSVDSNEYMWFNWMEDLPKIKNIKAQGIEGGEITFFCKVYRPYDNTVDYYMNARYFHLGHWWDYARRQGQPNFWFGRSSNDTVFYSFDEDGITFKEYPYENVSQDIKVRIAYSMKLMIGDHEDWD
jgi:hypothetical protein